jgi:hypothetical protein
VYRAARIGETVESIRRGSLHQSPAHWVFVRSLAGGLLLTAVPFAILTSMNARRLALLPSSPAWRLHWKVQYRRACRDASTQTLVVAVLAAVTLVAMYVACQPPAPASLAPERGRSFWPLILAHLERVANPRTTAPRDCRVARGWARLMLRARITPPADVEVAEDGSVVFTWREPGELGLFATARW